jgi:hypothetical protein
MEDFTFIIISNIVYFISKIYFKDININMISNFSLLDYKLEENFSLLSLPLKALIFTLKYNPFIIFLSILFFLIFNDDGILGAGLSLVKFTLILYILYYLIFIRKNPKTFFKILIKIFSSCGRMTELAYIFLFK